MTPTFCDFFDSFYYSNTYLPPVDLSDHALSQQMFAVLDPEAAVLAQELISQRDVQKVLSEPLSYETGEIKRKNRMIKKHGFKILSTKKVVETGETLPFYNVVEHPKLPGWVIKSGASRIPKDTFMKGHSNDLNEVALFTEEESILRIAMVNHLREVALKEKIDVIFPKKMLVPYAKTALNGDVTSKYCILCEKMDILSKEETIDQIQAMSPQKQIEMAQKISKIIQAGLVDASLDNIRLDPSKNLTIFDTEPAGLMTRLGSGKKGASVEKCARIGLYTLMMQVAPRSELKPFYEQLKRDYEQLATPTLSSWKVTLSVLSLGIIPLIQAVAALILTYLASRSYLKAVEIDVIHDVLVQEHLDLSEEPQEHEKALCSIQRSYYGYI
jgi:hypothetical protein